MRGITFEMIKSRRHPPKFKKTASRTRSRCDITPTTIQVRKCKGCLSMSAKVADGNKSIRTANKLRPALIRMFVTTLLLPIGLVKRGARHNRFLFRTFSGHQVVVHPRYFLLLDVSCVC